MARFPTIVIAVGLFTLTACGEDKADDSSQPEGDADTDTDADGDADAYGDTDADTGLREIWKTTGDCPELSEVGAAPEGDHETLYEGALSLGGHFIEDGVGFAQVFSDAQTWHAFLDTAAIRHRVPSEVGFDEHTIQFAWVFHSVSCEDASTQTRQVLLEDGTRHLDFTVTDDINDGCYMTVEAGSIHIVPSGPASVCARLHLR